MREARTAREVPLTDTKRVAAWNGLTLSALARAGRAFGSHHYIEAAERTARFILQDLMKGGRLHRSRLDGLGPLGFLEDYTFVTAGLLDLFEATGKKEWIEAALTLQGETQRLFAADNGGYYMTGIDGETLITREKPGHDGAIPSGNGVAAMNLFRLYALTADTDLLKRGIATVSAFIGPDKDPSPFSGLVTALDFHLAGPMTLVLILPEPRQPPKGDEALRTLSALYTPYAITVSVGEGAPLKALSPLLPILAGKKALEGAPTLYPCREGLCKRPVSHPAEFEPVIFSTEDTINENEDSQEIKS